MSKKSGNSGFTLLEVMLAMTLLSIMVVLLFSSLRISAMSWDKGEKKISEVNEKAVVYHFFKRHIPAIKPLWDNFSEKESVFSFQGQPQSFQFVSSFPSSAARKGLQLFTIKYEPNDDGIVFVVIKPFYPSSEDEGWQEEEVILLEGVRDFSVEYLEKDDFNNAGLWVDRWMDKGQLPALIKIKITLQNVTYWPAMVFPLKLAGNNVPADGELIN